eukprot:scaffold22422_cov19-Prasinocladus_malaysianus.AAC.1
MRGEGQLGRACSRQSWPPISSGGPRRGVGALRRPLWSRLAAQPWWMLRPQAGLRNLGSPGDPLGGSSAVLPQHAQRHCREPLGSRGCQRFVSEQRAPSLCSEGWR